MWIDCKPFTDLIKWGIAFSTAAEMELKVDNLKKEIIQLDKKKADAELKVTRIDSVSNDIVEQNMTEYYET